MRGYKTTGANDIVEIKAMKYLVNLIATGLLLVLAATLAGAPAAAQDSRSPLGVAVPDSAPAATGTDPSRSSARGRSAFARPQTAPAQGWYTRLWNRIQSIQASLHRELATSVRRLKSENLALAAGLLILVSFGYGVVHAIGPGHGKVVISSYVLAHERTARRGAWLALLAGFFQAMSAIVLVSILAIAMNAAGLTIRTVSGHLESASYALIAIVGAWLVIAQVRKLLNAHSRSNAAHAPGHVHGDRRGHAHEHEYDHDHSACCNHAHLPGADELEGPLSWKRALSLAFAVGVRPCTGAVLVLVFALTQGLFWAGVAATFAMSLGTAITVSALAIGAMGVRDLTARLAGAQSLWAARVYQSAALAGSLIILTAGALLFAASLGPARPF